MWSLKITTEQRYKYFEPILPDIKTNIDLFFECIYKPEFKEELVRDNPFQIERGVGRLWIRSTFRSFMIERTLDNNYQITFYE